ncbi:MAG: hypothetical protein GXN92_00800 [Candidatus Micrarchaeota archaeon]|nr:hypothetical protein [Candidatus Micrarchaeota archaeon]
MAVKCYADAMLGKFARLARVYGIDMEYFPSTLSDNEILGMLKGGILFTSDQELCQRSPVGCVYTAQLDMVELLYRAACLCGKGPSRCAYCNKELYILPGESAFFPLPPKVKAYHQDFFYCPQCKKLYWKGSHWARMLKLFKEVDSKLESEGCHNRG